MAKKIVTELEAAAIGGGAPYTTNLCATKIRAEALGATVASGYIDNLLVCLDDLSKPLVIEYETADKVKIHLNLSSAVLNHTYTDIGRIYLRPGTTVVGDSYVDFYHFNLKLTWIKIPEGITELAHGAIALNLNSAIKNITSKIILPSTLTRVEANFIHIVYYICVGKYSNVPILIYLNSTLVPRVYAASNYSSYEYYQFLDTLKNKPNIVYVKESLFHQYKNSLYWSLLNILPINAIKWVDMEGLYKFPYNISDGIVETGFTNCTYATTESNDYRTGPYTLSSFRNNYSIPGYNLYITHDMGHSDSDFNKVCEGFKMFPYKILSNGISSLDLYYYVTFKAYIGYKDVSTITGSTDIFLVNYVPDYYNNSITPYHPYNSNMAYFMASPGNPNIKSYSWGTCTNLSVYSSDAYAYATNNLSKYEHITHTLDGGIHSMQGFALGHSIYKGDSGYHRVYFLIPSSYFNGIVADNITSISIESAPNIDYTGGYVPILCKINGGTGHYYNGTSVNLLNYKTGTFSQYIPENTSISARTITITGDVAGTTVTKTIRQSGKPEITGLKDSIDGGWFSEKYDDYLGWGWIDAITNPFIDYVYLDSSANAKDRDLEFVYFKIRFKDAPNFKLLLGSIKSSTDYYNNYHKLYISTVDCPGKIYDFYRTSSYVRNVYSINDLPAGVDYLSEGSSTGLYEYTIPNNGGEHYIYIGHWCSSLSISSPFFKVLVPKYQN